MSSLLGGRVSRMTSPQGSFPSSRAGGVRRNGGTGGSSWLGRFSSSMFSGEGLCSLRSFVLAVGAALVLANLALLLLLNSGAGSALEHQPTGGPLAGTETHHLSSNAHPLPSPNSAVDDDAAAAAKGHGALLLKNKFDRSRVIRTLTPVAPLSGAADAAADAQTPAAAADHGAIVASPAAPSVPDVGGGDGTVHFISASAFPAMVLQQNVLEMVLVDFFAPWCGHCKNLAPEWAKAAKALQGHSVQLVAVDAVLASNKELALAQGVKSYPTIKAFRRGSTDVPTLYTGGRKSENIVQWVLEQLDSAGDARRAFNAQIEREANMAAEQLKQLAAKAAAGSATVPRAGDAAAVAAPVDPSLNSYSPLSPPPVSIAERVELWQRPPRTSHPADTFCDAQFGNGFAPSLSLCAENTGADAVAEEDVAALDCQSNSVTGAAVCSARNIVVDVSRMQVSRGGEPIESVRGRREDAEFVRYDSGAFRLRCAARPGVNLADQALLPFHLQAQMRAVQFDPPFVGVSACPAEARVIEDPVLFVTRYEYANLYHSMGDFYNAVQAALLHGWSGLYGEEDSGAQKVHVVFMDGHSAGALDEVWQHLFDKVTFVKGLPEAYPFVTSGSAAQQQQPQSSFCFRRAVFVSPAYKASLSVEMMSGNSMETPAGYAAAVGRAAAASSAPAPAAVGLAASILGRPLGGGGGGTAPLHVKQAPCGWHPVLGDFVRLVLDRYDVPSLDPFALFPAGTAAGQDLFGKDLFPADIDLASTPLVLVILRRDYLAHPRLQALTASRKVANEPALAEALARSHQWHAPPVGKGVHAVAVDFAALTVQQQLVLVRSATVLVGVHGAGLSSALFLARGASVIEIVPPEYVARPHFRYFAQWAGKNYVAMGASGGSGPGGQAGHVVDVKELTALMRALTAPSTPSGAPSALVPASATEGFRDHFIVRPTVGYVTARTIVAAAAAAAAARAAAPAPTPTPVVVPSPPTDPSMPQSYVPSVPGAAPTPYVPEADRPAGQPWTPGMIDDEVVIPPRESTEPLPSLQPTVAPEAGDAQTAATHSTQPDHRLCIIIPFRDSASPTSQGSNRTANLLTLIPYLIEHLAAARPVSADKLTPAPAHDFAAARAALASLREHEEKAEAASLAAGVPYLGLGARGGLTFVRDFEFLVVQQTEGVVFNKGALFNIGYLNARAAGCDYMVLHDVDQVPLSLANTYRFHEGNPVHLCSASSQYGYQLAYGTMVGGALLLSLAHYETVNGYSNYYFGWGQEDDDFYFRLAARLGEPRRLDVSQGRYDALTHPRVKDLDVTPRFTKGSKHLRDTRDGKFDFMQDGISNLRYRLRAIERFPQWTHGVRKIVAELAFDDMPTDLDH